VAALLLMVLAPVQLLVGHRLETRAGSLRAGLPLYTAATVVALAVTALSTADQASLIKVLLADVLVLAVAARLFGRPWLVYAAVWLFMLPIYLVLDLNVPWLVNRGLLLGLLGLLYIAVGYGLARRARRLAWPFLSAAVALGVAIIPLVWEVPAVAGPVLFVLAALYALAAVWLAWPWLLLPGLLALNLALLAANLGLFRPLGPTDVLLVISGALLGWALVGSGLGLRRAGYTRWHWPLYVAGAADATLALVAGLVAGGWLAVGLAAAAITYAGEAAVRRILYLAYLALGVLVLAIWAALAALNVFEPQAYAAPLGLALLGTGWNERRLRSTNSYLWPTLAGLLVLLGTAFVQSLGDRGELYALVLLVESVAALAWGIRTLTRCCCRLGGLALLLNAVAQLGPAFLEFSRWIQIGTTGALLLGAGLLALFKRDKILRVRRQMTNEWRQWSP
jgi:hypothetical protein